ncbi:SirB2 family protein [Alteromonas oceanisediminis]|uniref:SirB2 family protein n=1 Tax=Alteromonas oceanisediminis TaxID=2836180 RepID=UPI001BDB063C|nr:SirB2 family protein [Alteromonas oceanisediminis]MBT0587320.1 SirB2 family protein [Alteromonas oceanisediminis]
MYMMMKHLHLTAIVISISLFILRFIWLQMGSAQRHKKWVKVVPHIIDTVLLGSAIALCIILSQYPFVHGWVTFKLFGVIAYIVTGLWALKWAASRPAQWLAFACALVVLALTAKVALMKQPLFF